MCSHTMEARWWTRPRLPRLLDHAVLGGLANQVRDSAPSDRATATGRLGEERGRGRRGRGSRGRGGRTTSSRHYRRESPARCYRPPPLLLWWCWRLRLAHTPWSLLASAPLLLLPLLLLPPPRRGTLRCQHGDDIPQ
jgi:hypothetical protein